MYTETDDRGCEWTSDDGMATEREVRDFMYGLIRIVKPQTVIETGAYRGGMTMSMACAMKHGNISGKLDTCETDYELFHHTARRMDMFDFVTVHHMSGIELIQQTEHVDLAFLDSGGDRLEEMKALLPRLNPGAFVVLHDTNRAAERSALSYMTSAVRTQQLDLSTPRGLAILRVC